MITIGLISAQSSLSFFAQKYLCKCEDTYFILQKSIFAFTYKDSLGAKILRDDCVLNASSILTLFLPKHSVLSVSSKVHSNVISCHCHHTSIIIVDQFRGKLAVDDAECCRPSLLYFADDLVSRFY